jgi:hypothetical protein
MEEKEQRETKLKVIVDTNVLFAPLQLRVDVFDELKKTLNRNFELILLSSVKKELESIVQTASTKTRKQAAYALTLASNCKLIENHACPRTTTDEVIVEKAKEMKAIVFTNDKHLRKRLRDINVPVVYVRQKKRLAIDGKV